jgi:hypothetical protein
MRLSATFSTSKPTITAPAFEMTSRQLTSWTMVQYVRPNINQILETNLARTRQRTGVSLLSRPNFQNRRETNVLYWKVCHGVCNLIFRSHSIKLRLVPALDIVVQVRHSQIPCYINNLYWHWEGKLRIYDSL